MGSIRVDKRSVVLVPFPLQGHMTPMLQLGSILHSKGFSVIVAHTESNSPNPLNHPDFVFVSLADKLAGFDTSFMNLLRLVLAINENCRDSLADYLTEIMKDQDSPHGQVCCVIYDAVMYFVQTVASQLKIPSILLNTNCAAYVLSHEGILQFHAENRFPLPDSQFEDPVPGLDAVRFKDLPIPVSSVIPDILIDFLKSYINARSSAAVIWNTTEELEHSELQKLRRQHKVPLFAIGPFHRISPASSTSYMKEDSECISWLDKQAPNSVLYLSIGSLATVDDKELEETAWGLANSGQPFLWVIRPSSVNGLDWIEQLPDRFQETVGDRGLIVKWAPQKEVLLHPAVGGFWTHCGWNSTLESISAAVPMICRPRFGDQMINSRYLVDVWKVGLELEPVWNRRVIEETIRRLMVDTEGKRIRQRILDLKRQVDISTQKGGSSHSSLNTLADLISSFPLQK